jgi:tRNA A-37 threonylcarbamoyl transferase component Bud32
MMTTTAGQSGKTESAGRFRVIAELGEGGMARVHLALARGPAGVNKLVVLKTLRSHLANDPSCVEMFIHEARLAARLNHPNVVQTYEVNEDAGRQVMVMEYLEGQPLSHVHARGRKNGQLPVAMYVRMLCDALAGLHYAHELADFDGKPLNLVHRDVSPQNVFVTFDGQVKILDFGIAKAAVNAPSQTETGVLKGKVRYMAPEQIVGDPLDRRADVFAMGAILWEILTDEKIWAGVPDLTVMQRVTTGDIPSPRSVNPRVAEAFEAICMKAMSLDPDKRYATAQEVQIALEDALTETGATFKQRDLGSRVAELFADTRAEIRSIIEVQMRRAAELSAAELDSLRPVPLYGVGMTTTGRRQLSEGEGSGGLEARRKRLAIVLGTMCAGLLLAVGVWWGRHHSATEASSEPGVVSAAPPEASVSPVASAQPPPAGAASVEMRVTVSPSAARVYFDDDELSANPYVGMRARDESRHRIRGEAPGYVTQTVDVALDRDTSVAIALEREKPAIGPNVAKVLPPTAHSGGAAVAAASASAPKPNCTQPYYFDAQGIKKIRAECL